MLDLAQQEPETYISLTSDMAARCPRTRAQMARVDGVGAGKLDRYGDMFLRVIREYLEE